MTLEQLKTAIEDMYDQLDPDTIANWSVDGLDIHVDGETFTLACHQS